MGLWIGVLLGAIVALSLTWYYSRRHPRSPPGPIGLPILGSLLSINPEKPHYSLTEIAAKYGKNGACQLYLGSVRTVLLTDPKLIREAFSKEEFSGRAPLYLTHGIMKGQGIICAEGELWKDTRRLLATWMRNLGAAKISSNRESLEARISKRLRQFDKGLKERTDLEAPVDIAHLLGDTLGNTISELVHGVSFREDDKTWQWLLHIQEEGTKAMGVAAVVNFLPFLRFISSSTRKVMDCITSGIMQTHSIYRSILEIKRNKLKRKAGEHVEDDEQKIRCVYYGLNNETPQVHYFSTKDLILHDEDCILDYYIEEQNKRATSDPDGLGTKRLSDTQLMHLLGDLFGAGLDTTLLTLLWFFLFISNNTKEQEKIRNELQSQCGSREPLLSDLPRLPHLRAAINETQRIRSVVPVGIPHGCVKDTMVGDYLIQKGTMVMPLQWSLHMNTSAWDDPAEFKPSRFLESDGNVLNPSHFIPFQTGKRMCPGDEFARIILFKFTSHVLQHYHLEIAEPAPSLEGVMGLTMGPRPYKLIIKPVKR